MLQERKGAIWAAPDARWIQGSFVTDTIPNQVQLPTDYYFGISAASADMPDSFEAYKFIVHTLNPSEPLSAQAAGTDNVNHQKSHSSPGLAGQEGAIDHRLDDIQHRISELAKHLEQLEGLIKSTDSNAHNRHQELAESRPKPNQLNSMDGRIQTIERAVQTIQKDIEGRDYKGRLDQIQQLFEASHSNLMTHLPASMGQIVTTSAPRMWFFVFWIVLAQLVLAASYVVYKRRRANAPKKFL